REDRCFTLYFKAAGGLGKTHMFRRLPEILRGAAAVPPAEFAPICIIQPVDLYNFETRSPTVIEQRIINGMRRKRDDEPYKLSAAAPPEALMNASDAGTGTDLVLEWMRSVLPQLKHTLVVLCGRPLPDRADQRLFADLGAILLPTQVHELHALTDPDDIRAYLA